MSKINGRNREGSQMVLAMFMLLLVYVYISLAYEKKKGM